MTPDDPATYIWWIPIVVMGFPIVCLLISYIRWRNQPDIKWYNVIKKGLESNKQEWWGGTRYDVDPTISSRYKNETMTIVFPKYYEAPLVYIGLPSDLLDLSWEARSMIDKYIETTREKYRKNKNKCDEEIRKNIIAQKYYDKCVPKVYW